MVILEFDVPLFLTLGVRKQKNHWLTLNNYRNWQFHLNNNLKIEFKKQLKHLKGTTKLKGVFSIEYVFFYPDKRLRDIDNSLSVVSKFTGDALVELGILDDDNYKSLKQVIGSFGGIDKVNPRAKVIIRKIDE